MLNFCDRFSQAEPKQSFDKMKFCWFRNQLTSNVDSIGALVSYEVIELVARKINANWSREARKSQLVCFIYQDSILNVREDPIIPSANLLNNLWLYDLPYRQSFALSSTALHSSCFSEALKSDRREDWDLLMTRQTPERCLSIVCTTSFHFLTCRLFPANVSFSLNEPTPTRKNYPRIHNVPTWIHFYSSMTCNVG